MFTEARELGRQCGVVGGMAAAIVPWQGLGDALGWWWNEANAAIALGLLAAWFLRRWTSDRPPSLVASAGLGAAAGFSSRSQPCWCALGGYPLVYYLVGYVPRYTYPTVGILLMLAGAAVTWPAPATRNGAQDART